MTGLTELGSKRDRKRKESMQILTLSTRLAVWLGWVTTPWLGPNAQAVDSASLFVDH